MKVKTSITLSEDLLKAIDEYAKEYINNPGPPDCQEVSDLYRSEAIKNLRTGFAELIGRHQVPHAENILKTNDWVNYLYYCTLVRSLVSDPSALMIDWGGLYGHITMILRTMGYQNVFNYLLHQTPHYPLFNGCSRGYRR